MRLLCLIAFIDPTEFPYIRDPSEKPHGMTLTNSDPTKL